MYRHLSRAPLRRLSGHVCLSCRRYLHVTPPQRKDEFPDDWFSSFNDLSAQNEPKRNSTGQRKDRERQSASRAQKVKADSLEGPKSQRNDATDNKSSGKGKSLDDISSHALQGIPERPEITKDTSDEVRERYEAVLQRILSEDPAYRYATANKDWPGLQRLPLESHTTQDAPSEARSLDTLMSAKPFELLRKVPLHSRKIQTSIENGDEPAHPADVGLGKLADLETRTQVVRERPKWGGKDATSDDGSRSFNASFSSLQQADKVSPPRERPPTAVSAKPWGFGRPHADAGFADSPGDLAEAGMGQGHTSAALQTPTAVTSRAGAFASLVDLSKWGVVMQSDDSTMAANPVDNVGSKANADGQKSDVSKQEEESQASSEPSEATEQHATIETDPSPPRSMKTLRRARWRANRRIRRNAAKAEEALLSAEPSSIELPADSDHNTIVSAPEIQGQSMSEAMVGREIADALNSEQESNSNIRERSAGPMSDLPVVWPKDLRVEPLNIKQLPVPSLSYGLDRVLFNPGVTPLQDQHSRVYNFDPFLQNIMPVEEFDFNALKEYKTSSQDSTLCDLARAHDKKFVGSTSSMTSTLSHFHYLLSGWRELNTDMLSRQFPDDTRTFTKLNRAPTAIFLRYKNGSYAIDADKEHDSGNILMMLGKSMEKLLTVSKSEYERYRKSDPREISQDERDRPETYEYTTMGDFLMRSQLDAHDSRLPGTGTFDIKTRAIASIRMSASDYKPMLGYEILTQQGKYESYEREYYDMMRSTMLKYSLQARMGRMDGIFLAYHNVQRIFGFQYMPMSELDRVLHGQADTCLGDQEFKLSVDLLNKVLNQATAKFPNKSLRLHFETRDHPVTAMYIFAEPMEEHEIDKIQAKGKERMAEFERKMMGMEPKEEETSPKQEEEEPETTQLDSLFEPQTHAPLYAATIIVASRVNGHHVERPKHLKPSDDWSVEYLLKEMDNPAAAWATLAQLKAKRKKLHSKFLTMGDEDGAESLEDMEPNTEMHEKDGSLRTFDGFFLENLRMIAEKGRLYRQKIDEYEKDHGKVVYGQTATDGSGEAELTATQQQLTVGNNADQTSAVPEITGVDDYMSWMYDQRRLS